MFDFYHRLGLKNREVIQPWTYDMSFLAHMLSLCVCVHPAAAATVQCRIVPQVRLHNLMLASDSPRSALKISDFEYSKTEQVCCRDHAQAIL